MEGLQLTAPRVITAISRNEQFDSVSSVKVKVTKAMLVPEDFLVFSGETSANFPIIPARVGIGKIVETCNENSDFVRGTKVYMHAVSACGKCFECATDDDNHCSNFLVSGKNSDGYLRDFVVLNNDKLSILPPNVSDFDALFIEYVALCSNVIDSLNLNKGEHVVIVGGDLLGIILAQLIIYYQGIPILVDNNQNNINLAKESGVYYTLFADNKVEETLSGLTGGRFAKKVVYMTGSNLNTDITSKLASNNASICFAGFGTPNVRVNFFSALQKQLSFTCVTNGYGNIDTAINILANKVIDTENFKIATVEEEKSLQAISQISEKTSYDALSNLLIINMET